MSFPIRPIAESEWTAYVNVMNEGFGWTAPPGMIERFKAETEFDRTLAVFDGEVMVGTTGVFSLRMTVPGGRQLPVGGVTSVSVLPSHRRRGVLSQMMRRQLADIRERGEAVAALYASESGIYGRFGYGRAASELSFRIAKRAASFVADAPADPSLRIRVARAEVRAELEALFAAVVTDRPGRYERHAAFWDGNLADDESDQRGMGALRCVLAEDGGGVRGYALFRVKSAWDDNGVPEGELRLHELEAADPAAYALLWRHLLDRDLVTTLRAGSRPVDDPLQALLADPRQLRASWGDELWVRLVEVDRALTARAYAAPVDLVIEVDDDVCPWNAGRWRLTADPSGAECKQVEDEPDLTVPVAALGSAYLGEGQLGPLLGAGLLREHTPGAVRGLATAMSWSPRPWAGRVF